MTGPPQRADAVRRRLILVVVGIVGVLVALFLKLADSVRESDVVARLDSNAMTWVVHHRVGWLTQIARFFTFLGSAWVVTVLVVTAAAFLVVRHRRSDALLVVASAAGTALLVEVMKHGINRPRPPVSGRLVTVTGAAFPLGPRGAIRRLLRRPRSRGGYGDAIHPAPDPPGRRGRRHRGRDRYVAACTSASTGRPTSSAAGCSRAAGSWFSSVFARYSARRTAPTTIRTFSKDLRW